MLRGTVKRIKTIVEADCGEHIDICLIECMVLAQEWHCDIELIHGDSLYLIYQNRLNEVMNKIKVVKQGGL